MMRGYAGLCGGLLACALVTVSSAAAAAEESADPAQDNKPARPVVTGPALPCQSPPVVDTAPLVPLLRRQGLLHDGMSASEQQQAIRAYILARSKHRQKCLGGKPPKSRKGPVF